MSYSSSSSSFYTIKFLLILTSILFSRFAPSPWTKRRTKVRVAAFNSLPKIQRSFSELVTTSNLRKYQFYNHGASLLGNSLRPNTTLDRRARLPHVSLCHSFLISYFLWLRLLIKFALVSTVQMGRFAGTPNSAKNGVGPSRGVRSSVASKVKAILLQRLY